MAYRGWLDREQYPFEPHSLELDAGRMHYVDEGQGPPVLMVHGTPTWSFLWRHLIKGLSGEYRTVAPDLLGFGLSDKPENVPYGPEDHAKRLEDLVEHLGLRDLTLVVHDFGGPIGVSYAIRHPQKVRALVLFNTWMWSLAGDRARRVAGRLLGGPIGRVLYKRFNFSPRVIIRAAFGDRSKLTPDIHRHYIEPFPAPADRQAPWALARELIGSGPWYDRLWSARDKLEGKPVLILWGMKDPAFGEADLDRWVELFTNAEVVRFREAGHFVQEEEGEGLVPVIRAFLADLQEQR